MLVPKSFRAASLIVVASTIVVISVAVRAREQTPASPATTAQAAAPTVNPGALPSTTIGTVWWLEPDDPREYVGSAACEACHKEPYADWKSALHLQMTKPVADTTVLGDFRPGTKLSQNGRRYTFESRDGRYFISVSHGGRPAEKFEVHYTLGALRFQGYLSKLPDGRMYVLPVFWNAQWQRWLDWREITPVPDTDHDLRQIWNVTCFNCHAVNLHKNFDVSSKTYRTSWKEMGIGCEACHGPGAAHVRLARAWERAPATRPDYDVSRTNTTLSRTLKIFSARSAERRQVFDTCAYCHGNKTNVFAGFVPGQRYEDYALPFLLSERLPSDDPQGDFWVDGRPSRFNRPQALMQSGCFLEGGAVCTTCHVAHGSKNPQALKVPLERSDLLCLQCHAEGAGPDGATQVFASTSDAAKSGTPVLRAPPLDPKRLEEHTFHKPGSPGSRCVNCHMADVNWRLLMRRRDHTFRAPVPELTATLGIPNACNECHDDKSPEWAAATMDRWWQDAPRRAAIVEQAAAFASASEGDPAAGPLLARLVVDRRRSPIIRASAAEFLARAWEERSTTPIAGPRSGESQSMFVDAAGRQAPPRSAAAGDLASTARRSVEAARTPAPNAAGPTALNALRGAAADPEAMVRAMAVRALGASGDASVVPSLTARLIDPARVVRVAAAEALLRLDVVSLPEAAGAALARAQEEYAASLRVFGDNAGDHVALGWLDLKRHRSADARASFERALTLDPGLLQPRVFLGVLAAREGRYADAIREWETVKSRAPSWPNIDRLIEEARRR